MCIRDRATLMQACGYAMDMDYDTSASGAVTAYAADRLVRYFDYAPSSCLLYTSRCV